ncbi:MAG TPA: hypothetical protein VG053_07790 [Solirubrobacteraceae bacterium]|nr:hypothetical protein [Solirubrobacteraceae bacterium]
MSTPHRKRALILLGAATVAFTVILEVIDPSHVSHGPTILDFEFAGSQARASQIIAEWGPKGRSAAHLSLLLDYGYMLSYGLFFALAGFAVRDMARAREWQSLAAIGAVVPFFALAAASFDASETSPCCSRLPATVAASRRRLPPSARRSSSRSSPSPSSTRCVVSCVG